MVQTFPNYYPDNNSSEKYKNRVLAAQFGDGYQQMAGDGINNELEKWALNFSNRPKAQVDAIRAFLVARAGVESFYWTPPGETALSPPKRWLCKNGFERNRVSPTAYNISFEIERVYSI